MLYVPIYLFINAIILVIDSFLYGKVLYFNISQTYVIN